MKKFRFRSMLIVMLICILVLAQPVSASSGWMSECKPYQYTSATEYSPTSAKGFTIGGNTYYEGYVFYCWYQTSLSQVLYNLKGEYETFSFDIGRVDGTTNAPSKLYVYKDGLIAETIDLDPSVLKTHVTLDVDGVKSLKLVCETQGHYYDVYYGVFNGAWVKNGTKAPAVKNDPWISDCAPYDATNTTLLYSTKDQAVVMGGDSYSDAIRFYLWNPARTATASYNLDSAFKSFTFTFGHVDKTTRANAALTIKLDGVTDQVIEMKPDSLPQQVTVDLTDVDQMILQLTSSNALDTYDIYYAIGAGHFVSNGKVRSIALSESSITFQQCTGTYKLQADVRPRDAVNTNVTWSSSDKSVATVSSSGKVTAVGTGTAVITAVTADGGYKQSCTVTVPDKHSWESVYTIDKTATTSRAGSKSIHCSLCGASNPSSVVEIPQVTSCQLSYTKTTYNGNKKTPSVTVMDSTGRTLAKGTDYTLSYSSSRTSVGRYYIKVNFTGAYSGSKTLYFTIVPKAPSTVNAELYGGYDDVKISWSKCTGATGYYVYYKNASASTYKLLGRTTNRYITTASRSVDLADGVKYTFKIVPYYYNESNDTRYSSINYETDSVYTLKKLNAPTVTTSGTKVKVTWNNISGETGYQISRSSSKTGTYTVLTKATTSGTYSTVSATKGTTYYYKVRAYKVITNSDGEKTYIYGPWSNVTKYTR